MKKVFKYSLELNVTAIELPKGAQVLTVALQANVPQLWALVNPHSKEFEFRTFVILSTGEAAPREELAYIGTVFPDSYVFHVFEMK